MFFDFIRGGQILSHNLEMLKQVVRKLFAFSLLITFLFVCIKFKKDFKIYQIKNAYSYMLAEHYYFNLQQPEKIFVIDASYVPNVKEKYLRLSSDKIVRNNFLKQNKIRTINLFKKNLLLSVIVYILSFLFIIIIFLVKGYLMNKNNYLRGARIVPLKILNKIIKKYNKKNKKLIKNESDITRKTEQLVGLKFKHYNYKIAGALYPIGSETLHTIITGATGTGKTVLITDLINQIRRNGDRAIIYDRMGTFVSKFYNGDEIEKKN